MKLTFGDLKHWMGSARFLLNEFDNDGWVYSARWLLMGIFNGSVGRFMTNDSTFLQMMQIDTIALVHINFDTWG